MCMQLGMDSAKYLHFPSCVGKWSRVKGARVKYFHNMRSTLRGLCDVARQRKNPVSMRLLKLGVVTDIVFVIKNCINCAVYLINVIVNNGVEQYNDFTFLGHLLEGACHLGSITQAA
jgi:hypothetical protein